MYQGTLEGKRGVKLKLLTGSQRNRQKETRPGTHPIEATHRDIKLLCGDLRYGGKYKPLLETE